jgi:hypothetical protein
MKTRFWAVLFAMLMFVAGSTQAQDVGDDAIRRGCPGLMTCYLSCRSNYNNAIDSCGWIEWTGFGAYCEAEAAYQLTICVNGCYAQC